MTTDPSITPASIIARFGGCKPLAERAGISPSTVGNWPSLGIPAKRFGLLMDLAREDGVDLTWEELVQATSRNGGAERL